VLFCEVGDVEQVTAIAEFCWGEVRGLADGSIDPAHPDYLRAVHSLRFLRDAFRTRKECLVGFRESLEDFLAQEVSLRHGLLPAKIALEATGLASLSRVEAIVVTALDTGDPWLSETAMRACRHLSRIGPALESRLRNYIDSLPIRTFLARRKTMLFTLSLSDGFQSLYRYVWWMWLDYRLILVVFIVLMVLEPRMAFDSLLGACPRTGCRLG
jgi:hypothetical protein